MSAPASPDTRSRLLERAAAAGLEVPDDQVERLVVFYELLFRWNRTINLTALQDSLEALDRLLLEPLSAARHLEARGSLMDVGSGGGSPGIPLSIALAPTRVLLVESRGRKAAFLREALRTLNIPGDVYQGRFEELPQTPTEPAALISVRAVRMSHSELNVLRQLLGPGGVLALFRTGESESASFAGSFERVGRHQLLLGSSAHVEVLRALN